MRVNSRVFTERTDMLDGIRIPNCPNQFKTIAENIMNMAVKLGYSPPSNYHTMTELDKILMTDYWKEYDGLFKDMRMYSVIDDFNDWFVHKATAPELIRRARQWLAEHNYIILDADVAERAYEAETKFRRAIKQ